jgi:hypothetical protein
MMQKAKYQTFGCLECRIVYYAPAKQFEVLCLLANVHLVCRPVKIGCVANESAPQVADK